MFKNRMGGWVYFYGYCSMPSVIQDRVQGLTRTHWAGGCLDAIHQHFSVMSLLAPMYVAVTCDSWPVIACTQLLAV
jgi:hypothetical protein